MAKIVWLEKKQVKEKEIPSRGFVTVGRGADNTIVLNDPQVSRYHVRMAAGPHGCLLKDLQSVHGVMVNGDTVHTRFLKDGDIIRIGGQVLEFVDEPQPAKASVVPGYRFETGLSRASRAAEPETPKAAGGDWCAAGNRRAFLRYVAGPAKGRILTLDRPLVSVGDPDGCHIAISCRTNGLYLLNLGKGIFATLNDKAVHGAGAQLQDGDKIGVGEDLIEVRVFRENAQ